MLRWEACADLSGVEPCPGVACLHKKSYVCTFEYAWGDRGTGILNGAKVSPTCIEVSRLHAEPRTLRFDAIQFYLPFLRRREQFYRVHSVQLFLLFAVIDREPAQKPRRDGRIRM